MVERGFHTSIPPTSLQWCCMWLQMRSSFRPNTLFCGAKLDMLGRWVMLECFWDNFWFLGKIWKNKKPWKISGDQLICHPKQQMKNTQIMMTPLRVLWMHHNVHWTTWGSLFKPWSVTQSLHPGFKSFPARVLMPPHLLELNPVDGSS